MPKNSHEVPVIRVKLEPHPNADKLALVRVDDIRVVGVRKEEWQDGDLGAFIQADMVVPESAEFEWLGHDRRIRPRKFRGVMSWGLLVRPPEGAQEGEDVAERMGIVRYQPPESLVTSGDQATAPSLVVPVYDLEPYYKYHHLLQEGEPIIITEKVHGENWRGVYWDNELHIGSHRAWKKPGTDVRWRVLEQYPQVEVYIRSHEGTVVYGETFGYLDLRYGASSPGEFYFRAFDARLPDTTWLPYPDLYCCTGMATVPLLYKGPYSREAVEKYTSGNSTIGDHLREGCVIEPVNQRYDVEIGRVKLKSVSMEYLERRK